MLIDDFIKSAPFAANGARWQLFTDTVMGGVSRGNMCRETIDGRSAVRMRGEVSLDNNGGFVQISLDLASDGDTFDARAFDGFEIDVLGNGEHYNLHVRTEHTVRPWQSYRQTFLATASWRTVRLPFRNFVAHRIDKSLDVHHVKRIGLVAIGRAFTADLSVSRIAFYSTP
jgi:hypothetical protein